MKLSIIIVSYEQEDIIRQCIDSIRTYNDLGDEAEVIVVEQSRDDSLFESLKTDFEDITVIRNTNNGFGAGCNRGAQIAKGDILLFLNPDTLLIEGVFKEVIMLFENEPKIGIVGCRLLDLAYHKVQSFFWLKPYGNFKGILWRLLNRLDLFIPQMMYITGADMFVRKSAFTKVGGFDEKLFLYCEETDLTYQIKNIGYEPYYKRDSRIIHLEGKTTGSNYVINEKRKFDSLMYLCEKYQMSKKVLIKKAIKCAKERQIVFSLINQDRVKSEEELINYYREYERER